MRLLLRRMMTLLVSIPAFIAGTLVLLQLAYRQAGSIQLKKKLTIHDFELLSRYRRDWGFTKNN